MRWRVSAAVHPRWRGEHVRYALRLHPAQRFIPAGAGNTPTEYMVTTQLTVHPRWRGEHAEYGAVTSLRDGSSPLARGTLQLRRCAVAVDRFIPAGAGNTALPAGLV